MTREFLKHLSDKFGIDASKEWAEYLKFNLKSKEDFFDGLVDLVTKQSGISWELIASNLKKGEVANTRQFIIWALCSVEYGSTTEIGRRMGRDHSSVIHARNVINDRLSIRDAKTMMLANACGPYIEEYKKQRL